jgi:hypothetical protein
MMSDNPLDGLVVIAIVGVLVGYAWMLRIAFAKLEQEAPAWRYRAPRD